MQAFNVYLASRTEQENQILQRKLEILTQEFRSLRFIGLHPQGLSMSANERMAAAVINVPEWGVGEMRYMRETRAAGYTGPILVTAKPTGAALKTLRSMRDVVFLEKPFDGKNLLGILRKMLTTRAVSQQVHRRFNTDETCELEFYGRNDRFMTKLCNMSKGGAYVEFLMPTAVRVGDVVRLTVDLRDVRRVYSVPARVVWTQRGGSSPAAGIGVGVAFIGVPDVKRSAVNEF